MSHFTSFSTKNKPEPFQNNKGNSSSTMLSNLTIESTRAAAVHRGA